MKNKKDKNANWYFVMGIAFFVIGIATSPAFLIIGMAFIAIGLAYRGKKTKKRR